MLTLKIPSRPEFVGVVRLVIAGLATRLNCGQEEIEDLKVAVAEACNNAILEGSGDSEVLVDCLVEDGKLSVVVTDRLGREEGKASSKGADEFDETWLLLIRALMDEVECRIDRDRRRRVRMIKYLERTPR